jgi:Holliday junction DNA helicase RuvA
VIGSLRGTLLDRLPAGEVLVEVAGVGYRVTVAPATAVALGEPGREVFLHVHHHRREDAETLYGFLAAEDRLAFEALLGAHGVGPTLALAILSVHPPVALRRVLVSDDLDALCLVPGVGKKTAARLLVELKSRLDVPGLEAAAAAGSAGSAEGIAGSPQADVRDALTNLGYGPDEVTTVLRDLPDDDDPSALLRVALQRLAVA